MHRISGVNGIIVEQFRRQCCYVSSGRLFFPGGILEFLAAHERVVPELVPRLWDVVPSELQEKLTTTLREAASPEFRLPLWLRGFSKGMAELEADADERSKNLRAWAMEFCRFWSASASIEHD